MLKTDVFLTMFESNLSYTHIVKVRTANEKALPVGQQFSPGGKVACHLLSTRSNKIW